MFTLKAIFGRIIFKSVAFVFLLALVVLLIFEAYTLIVSHSEGKGPLPSRFGNFERVRALLKNDEGSDRFSFAAIGDTSGCGTFERICEGLRDEPLSFVVLLGDSVREGTPGYHQYFRAELAHELAMPFPIFYVVGNHDVDLDTFPLSEFEKTYGPTNFSFEYKGCLFVVLRMVKKLHSIKESCAFLESVLSGKRSAYRKVFVFMHIAPPVSEGFVMKRYEDSEKVVELADRFNIDYIIAGDYHGYSRIKHKNTVYLVTAGGGAHIRNRKFGNFHHATVLEVGPHSVSEKILFVERDEEFQDQLERFALAEAYPWMSSNRAAAIVLNVGILGLSLLMLAIVLRRRHVPGNDVSKK